MKQVSIFLFILLFKFSYSQTEEKGRIIILHPTVGNTIDLNEKKQFSLFPEYTDSLFESAQLVKYNDSTYTFLIKTSSGKSFERPATSDEMRSDYYAIENAKPAQQANSEENTDYYSQKVERDEKARSRHEVSAIAFEVFFDLLSFTLYILQNAH